MRNSPVLALVVYVMSLSAAHAQELTPTVPVAFPGSFWIAVGHAGPAEPDNTVGQAAFEQGLTLWREGGWFFGPFVNLSLTADAQGYEWNRKHPTTVGVKLQRHIGNGVAQVGGGVMFERDPSTGRERHSTVSASYWAGWQGDSVAHARGWRLAFPGSLNAYSGLLTGRDPKNWMSAVSVQQGVMTYRWHGIAVVPYGGTGITFDTKRRTWQNRLTNDAGLKAIRAVTGGVIEVGVAERHQFELLTERSTVAPVGFVNLWIGWN